MRIGPYEIYSIETSEFGLDGGAMFGIIPKTMWEKFAPPDKLNRINMVTRSLLLVSENRNILIDTGNGTKWDKKFQEIYNIDTSLFSIERSLAKYGFEPEDITDVICTHLHFDHVGGNTKIESGKVVPTFANAKYWISKENWELANDPSQKDKGSFLEDNWKVLLENNMIEIISGKESFIENIDIFLSYGHTLGLMHPIITDGDKTVFYGSDLFPTLAHIPIQWVMAYDVQPVITMKEKQYLLNEMYQKKWILFFEHDPNIQACRIGWDGKKYNLKKDIIISE
tara:strand:+ start:70 stop:918 length:849 start_codon:yes stop_codon:yes gene_type:complete